MSNNQEIIQPPIVTTGTTGRSVTIPFNNPVWAQLISAFFHLSTDATAGARSFNIDLIDSAGNILSRLMNMPMNPSQSFDVEMANSPNPGSNTSTGQVIPESIPLPPNSSIKITDINNHLSTSDSISMNAVISY